MRRIQLVAFAAALVMASLAISACGGSGQSQDQKDISAAIDKGATSGDPAACTEVQTANFNAQTNGGNGDPTAQCQKTAAQTAAKSVDVTNVNVTGSTATADVAATGSILDGQTIEIGLVKDGSRWKLDKVNSFTKFDRTKFVAALEQRLASSSGIPASALSCLKQQFNTASDAQLQAVLLTANGGDQLFSACSGK
jgi:ABC-type oligopeptide transport system substrate-binding subunit